MNVTKDPDLFSNAPSLPNLRGVFKRKTVAAPSMVVNTLGKLTNTNPLFGKPNASLCIDIDEFLAILEDDVAINLLISISH